MIKKRLPFVQHDAYRSDSSRLSSQTKNQMKKHQRDNERIMNQLMQVKAYVDMGRASNKPKLESAR